MPGLNDNMSLSAQGRADLRLREGTIPRYYNDIANNCTFGVGTLVHTGPCSAEELRTPVTDAMIDAQLSSGIATAEQIVRGQVQDHALTQAQFDAAVSFAYTTGSTGAQPAMQAANRGDSAGVVRHFNENVFVHPRDRSGHRGAPVRSKGLANRRAAEAAPFP
jgi:lysozyme